MSDENKSKPRDAAVEKELAGVPEEFRDDGLEDDSEVDDQNGEDSLSEALDSLRGDLEAAKQDVLYAKADAQNVRRRAEKDVQDARNYAATGFARDILSVADNLGRAVDSVPTVPRPSDGTISAADACRAPGLTSTGTAPASPAPVKSSG
ncbi:MAG: nucleotide exchange factor GrpE, partial [Alphaproteobacteria bacterium]|nr:nucleotide exchange factor GrpE [Alphaproteobacteria bacterium]